WEGSRVFSIVRQTVINALAAAAERAGAEIVTGSGATAASADGGLVLADGRQLKADLIVGAGGSNSAVREAVRPPGETQVSGRWRDAAADREDRTGARGGGCRHHGRILVRHPARALHAVQRERYLRRADDARSR